MKVAVIGTRNIREFDRRRFGEHIPADCTLIISGGASGIDSEAELFARELGIPFRKIEPDYELHGRRAPLVRDTRIVQEADLVLAFWDFRSRGTSFTIKECLRLGVPVRVIRLEGAM